MRTGPIAFASFTTCTVYAVITIAVFFAMLAVTALTGTFRTGLAAYAFVAVRAMIAVAAIAAFFDMLAVAFIAWAGAGIIANTFFAMRAFYTIVTITILAR